MAKDAPGMRGKRSRDESGELRRKRSDTHVGTIEQEYGVDFGERSDMKLGALKEKRGVDSLSELLKQQGKK